MAKKTRVVLISVVVVIVFLVVLVRVWTDMSKKKEVEENFVSYTKEYIGVKETEVSEQTSATTEEMGSEVDSVIENGRENRYAEEIMSSKGSASVNEYWNKVGQGVDPFIAKITVMEPDEIQSVNERSRLTLHASQAEYELTIEGDVEPVDTELLSEDLALFKLSNPENGDDICRLVMHVCKIRGWDVMSVTEYYDSSISIFVDGGYGTGIFLSGDDAIIAFSVEEVEGKVAAIIIKENQLSQSK